MDFITSNLDNLIFSWDPRWIYENDVYRYIPRLPQTATREELEQTQTLPIPKVISMHIRPKIETAEFYNKLSDIMREIASSDKLIQLVIHQPYTITTKQIDPKYQDKVKEIEIHNSEVRDRIDDLITQLEEYAYFNIHNLCETLDPMVTSIPKEYYIYTDTIHYHDIVVYCQKGTCLYDVLYERGILEQTYPS
jgi:hypothetical protein